MRKYEMARVCGVTLWTIHRWLRLCGMGHGRPPGFRNHGEKKVVVPVNDQALWRTKEWLQQKYVVEGLSVKLIAKMVDRDPKTVWDRIRRHKIMTRSPQEVCWSNHPCANRKWLEEHYIDMNLSFRQVARLANVSLYNVYWWLLKFGVPIKDGDLVQYEHMQKWNGVMPPKVDPRAPVYNRQRAMAAVRDAYRASQGQLQADGSGITVEPACGVSQNQQAAAQS